MQDLHYLDLPDERQDKAAAGGGLVWGFHL